MLPLIIKYPRTSAALALAAVVVAIYAAKQAKDSVTGLAADVGGAINPLNHDNIFNSAVNSFTQAVTGDTQLTLGSWIYEVLNPGWDKGYYETPYPVQPAQQATRDQNTAPNLSDLMIP